MNETCKHGDVRRATTRGCDLCVDERLSMLEELVELFVLKAAHEHVLLAMRLDGGSYDEKLKHAVADFRENARMKAAAKKILEERDAQR